MKRLVCTLSLLFAVGWASASPDAPKLKSPYRITGMAVSVRDGAPIPFCRLRVTPALPDSADAGPPGSRDVSRRAAGFAGGRFDGFRSRRADPAGPDDAILADAHGRFVIDIAKAGAWRLSGIARGFRLQGYDVHESFSSAIVLTEAAPTASVTFRLEPNAAISGAILDEAGEPVMGAQVQAEDAATPDSRAVAFSLTDDRGHYELAGLAPGSYRVRVDARPWYAAGSNAPFPGQPGQSTASPSPLDPSLDVVYPTTWFPGSNDRRTGDILKLSGGEDRQADFHLLPMEAAHLSFPRAGGPDGSEEGRGAAGPVVLPLSSQGFGAATGNVHRTANSWEVDGLAPGTYEVRMPGAAAEMRQLTVKGGGLADLSSAPALVRVSLVFEGETDARPAVSLVDTQTGQRYVTGGGRPDFGGFGGRRRDGDGLAISVPAGRYQVALSGGSDIYLGGIRAIGAAMEGEVVRITDGAPTLTLKLAAGKVQLSGLAHRSGGAPATGAMVLLVPAAADAAQVAAHTARTETNTDGSFALTSVIPGPYILVVLDGGWTVNWQDPGTIAGYLMHGMPLDLQPASKQVVNVIAVAP